MDDFASLSPGEGHALAAEMVGVLRSLGVDIDEEGDLMGQLFVISGFAAQCRRATEPVAHDLQATWASVPLHVEPFWPDGEAQLTAFIEIGTARLRSQSLPGMEPGASGAELAANAADQVSEALYEFAGYRWPVCHRHDHRLSVHMPVAASVWPGWLCDGSPKHTPAPVGQLSPTDAGPREMWWATTSSHNPVRP